jgi:hypothetical protein
MPPRAQGIARVRAERRAAHRARRFAGLGLLACVLVLTAALTAFAPEEPQANAVLAPPSRLLPAGPPHSQIVAFQGALRIQLPIPQSRVTAIGYHAAGDSALALEPVGRQGNQGAFARLAGRIFGGDSSGLVWYQLSGGSGPQTSALDVGAAPGTDVYSPVDGTIVGITDYVLSGRTYGVRLEIRPVNAPSVLVSLTRLRADPALSVGSSVAAGTSKIGTVLDLSRVERQALARYTQDAGNHVSLEVHPAAALSLP